MQERLKLHACPQVYIVDPQLPTKGVAHAPPMHTDPSFPPMPHNAVPYHEYEPRPIRHNQLGEWLLRLYLSHVRS